jgi:glycosyltransferase involved in cell wall biosynthesis
LSASLSRILFLFESQAKSGILAMLRAREKELQKRGVDARSIVVGPQGAASSQGAGDPHSTEDFATWERIGELTEGFQPEWIVGVDFPSILPLAQELAPNAGLVSETYNYEQGQFEPLLKASLLRNMMGFIVPSPSLAEFIRDQLGPQERVSIVPPALTDHIPQASVSSSPVEVPETPVILWVGESDPRQNWRGFLDLASSLRRKTPLKFWIVITQISGQGALELKEEAWERPVGDDFWLMPRPEYSEMQAIYRRVAMSGGCLVSTSWEDPFPISVLEAMASGCPVVAPGIPAMQDFIQHQGCGWIYPVMDLERAYGLVLEVMGDPSTRSQIIYRAELHARSFTPENSASILMATLDEWSAWSRDPVRPENLGLFRQPQSRQAHLLGELYLAAQAVGEVEEYRRHGFGLAGGTYHVGGAIQALKGGIDLRNQRIAAQEQDLKRKEHMLQSMKQDAVERAAEVQQLVQELAEEKRGRKVLGRELEGQRKRLADMQIRLKGKEERLLGLEGQLQEVKDRQSQLEEEVARRGQTIRERDDLVAEIKGSRGWRLIRFLWGWKVRLTPIGSRRERMISRLLRAIEVWREEGFGGVWERAVTVFGARMTKPLHPHWWGSAPDVDETMKMVRDFFQARLSEGPEYLALIFSAVAYEESEGQRATWIARTLAARKIPTLFAAWRWSPYESVPAIQCQERVLQIPLDVLSARAEDILSIVLDYRGEKLFLIEFPHPSLFRLVNLANAYGWRTIYDIIDDWKEFSHVGQASWYEEHFERYLIKNVDSITATSEALKEKAVGFGATKVALLPNAYLGPAFSPTAEREELPRGRLTLGYFGHLTSSWFDWTAISSLAGRHPEWVFHVIGYGGEPPSELPSNVLRLGKVAHDLLPRYAANWDVALIPFKHTRLSLAVDPVKIYEYLALGLPVVTLGMPHLSDLPYVWNAQTLNEMESKIEEAAGAPFPKKQLEQFLACNTWERRVDHILTLIQEAGGRAPWVEASQVI